MFMSVVRRHAALMTTATILTPAFTMPVTTAPAARPARFAGGVHGLPRLLLRVEGGLILAAAMLAHARLGGSWGTFALLFLLPDLSMLAYLVGPRAGAAAYNAAHSHIAPALLVAAAYTLGAPLLLLGAAIWAAHIGFDRMLGYGLKYGTAFGDTHLGRVGSPRP